MSATTIYRPAIAPGQQYIQWTKHHRLADQGLPPCATRLWQCLLEETPSGVEQLIDLNELRFTLSEGRHKTYCIQSLKNAIWKWLVPRGLIQVVRSITKRVMKVVAYHAGPTKQIEKKFAKFQTNLNSRKENCDLEPETHIRPFSIQSISKNSTDTHPPHPAAVLQKNCFEEKEEISQEVMVSQTPLIEAGSEQLKAEPINPGEDKFSAAASREENLIDALAVEKLNAQLAALAQKFTLDPCPISLIAEEEVELEEEVSSLPQAEDYSEPTIPEDERKLYLIEDCGIRLNAQLEALVRDFTLEEVLNATAYYLKTKRTKEAKGQKIDRPAGWLTDCLRQSWWKTALPEKSREQEEFETWYEEAKASGLVENVPISRLGTDRHGQPLVRLRKPGLFGAPYTPVPWRELWQATIEQP